MNQLMTTNQFKLEETLMQRVFEASGYQFTIVTPNNSEPHFIAKEVADALGYAKTHTLTQHMDDVIKLTNSNGLGFLIEILDVGIFFMPTSTIWDGKDLDRIPQLSLIPESALLKYTLTSATKPKAKVVSEKLYQALEQGQPELYEGLVKEEHPLYQRIHTETEAEGFGSEFASWYFERVVKSRYLRSWNRRERKYNWLMNQSLGFYVSLNWEEKQFKFIFQEKEDAGNLLHFASLYRPANFKAIMTPC